MGVADAMHNGDTNRRLEALERLVRELSAARTLESASVGDGGIRLSGSRLTVTDPLSRQELVRLGVLEDGTQGLEIVDPDRGVPVSLSTMAFGLRTARGRGSLETSSGDWVEDPDGAEVTVRVGPSGILMAAFYCRASVDDIGPGGLGYAFMDVRVRGATERDPTQVSAATWSSDRANAVTIGRERDIRDLNPGLHTVTAMYSSGGGGEVARFTNRYLRVQPF